MKRFAAFILALVMTLSLCPVTALAEMIPARYEMSLHYVAEDDGISNDELFEAYAQRVFDEAVGIETPGFYRTSALEEGTLEKEIYDALKAELAKVAAGTKTSTEITVFLTKGWSKEDLGVTEFISGSSLTAETDAAIKEKLTLVYTCLLADCPLELYWHDKTVGMETLPFSCNISGDVLSVGSITYQLAVATDYSATGAAGTFTTDINKTSAASATVANAQAIVAANASKSDLEKLTAYKDAICEIVSYDSDAAATMDTSEGVNPWQMIYVFDGDEKTNVVCEGYAKAFQFLCDLSYIDDIECHTVSGNMSGGTGEGRHMWNVVTMDDGRNYLVDVTNCDDGTIGAPDKLFMAYTANSADENQTHTFTIDGQNITFTYDETMKDLFCEGYLDLATTDYGQSDAASAALSGNSSVQVGTDVTLTLTVSGTNIMGVETTLEYDEEVLEYRSHSGLLDGWDVVCNGNKFVMHSVKNPINEPSGVVSVTFRVSEEAAADAQLNVAFKDIVVSDGNIDADVGSATWTGTAIVPTEACWGLATGEKSDQAPAEWVGSGPLADAMTYANGLESGTAYIRLSGDVNPSAPLEFAEGKTTILDLHGYDIDRGLTEETANGNVITVYGNLTLCDTSENAEANHGRITGGYDNDDGGGVCVSRSATFIMDSGTIIGNTTTYQGGGVLCFGSFIMNGGAISENTAKYGAGVALFNGANFTMTGGTISKNNSYSIGGGVYVENGTVTMNGGVISKNTATHFGGGVVNLFGTVTMSNGAIAENTAETYGAGVSCYDGTFTMDGGIISQNASTYYGGGVVISNNGKFTMKNGTITENAAGTYGGGVVCNGGTLTMNGGSISKNVAAGGAGGVNVGNGGTFTMNDGTISGNAAGIGAGGVAISPGCTFAMNGGIISGNTAVKNGGGVWVCSDSTMQLSGASVISGNKVNGVINNIYLEDSSTIDLMGALGDDAAIGVTTETDSISVVVAQGGGTPAYTITDADAAKVVGDDGSVGMLDSANNAVKMVKLVEPTAKLGVTSSNFNLLYDSALSIPVECNYEILDVAFENEELAELFDITMSEDGSEMRIVLTGEPEDMTWAEWGKAMAGSYESAIKIEYFNGKYYTIPQQLTIKLTATAPKVTATAVKFNSFISGDEQQISLTTTNGVIETVEMDTAKENPAWISEAIVKEDRNNDGVNEFYVSLDTVTPPSGKSSGKLNLEVWLKGWRAPAQVAVSVSAAYTAPKLKLSASSVNLMSSSQYQEPVALTLLSGDKTAFEAIGVTDLCVADMTELSEKDQKTYAASAYAYVAEYSEETGAFTLMTDGKPINGKVLLFATIKGATAEVSIPLTVKVTMPTLKANPTKVTLNTAKGYAVGERDEMTVAFSGAIPDFWYNDVSYEVTPPKVGDATKLMMENNGDGTVTFYANEGIVDGSYKVNVTVGAAKPVAITVTAKATLPKLKLDKSSLTLNTAMGDHADVQQVAVTDSDANYDFVLKQDEVKVPAGLSVVVGENNVLAVSTAATTAPGSYKVEIDHKMPGGQSVKSTLTVKVVNKLPTVKLSSSSVSLHNEVGIAEIPVSGLIGYENCSLVPVVSNFVSVTGDSEKLTVTLTENAEVGKTYKVNVEYNVGNEKTKAVALSVKVVNAITATASIKGNMDVTRPGNTSSNFTFKYTGWYPGEYNDAAYEPTLVWEVYAMNGKNKIADYEEYDFVNGKGSLVASSDDNNGGWFCDIDDADYGVVLALNTDEGGAWKNGEVNPKYTYNVTFKLVFGDGEEFAFPTKAVKMTVKQGSVKFAADVKAVDLYKQSDAVSGTFVINKTDKDAANVADIAKVAIAASKTPSAFVVIETGDGYAIKVVNPTIAKSGTVKLNIWLEGNYEEGCESVWDTKSPAYRKPNATVSLKVNVK